MCTGHWFEKSSLDNLIKTVHIKIRSRETIYQDTSLFSYTGIRGVYSY